MNTNEKIFHCIQCDKSFRDSQSLDQHCRAHNTLESSICNQCGTSFEIAASLKTQNVTNSSLKCAECSEASTVNTDVAPSQGKSHATVYGKPNGAKFNKQNWPHVQQICYQGQE